jgi:two-component sensor histidine kinase
MTNNPFSSLVREPEPPELLLGTERRRAKNTLQVLASLLSLQSRDVADPVARGFFSAAEERIRIVATLYDRLARGGQGAQLDFSDALHEIVATTVRNQSRLAVSSQVFADPLQLDLESSIPLALLAYELLSDALAHAFEGRAAGRIEVALRLPANGTECVLSVADDGASRALLGSSGSDGVRAKLVDVLIRQLRARLTLESVSGTRLAVRFPLPS